MATMDERNDPVAQMSDRRTRTSVVVKEGTGTDTARTPDTETKLEGMKIDYEFSDLSNDYTIQEFDFEKGNNFPFCKRKTQEKFNILERNTFSLFCDLRDY